MNNNWEGIIELLGTKNVEEIKKAITANIIENFEEAIGHEWILAPDDFYDLWTEFIASCFETVKKKHKKEITETIEKKIVGFINEVKNEQC